MAHITGLTKHFRAFDKFANVAPISLRFSNDTMWYDSFLRTIDFLPKNRYILDQCFTRRGFTMGAGNRTVESISSSGQVQRLLAGKVATTVRAFRVPDNYGHRSARLRLRSFWLQNHRSARLTKGSETVLSVLDLKAIKAHRGPWEIAQKIFAIPFLTSVSRRVARYKTIVDRKLTERSGTATLSIR